MKSLTKASLNEALCYFIPEVTKSKGQGMYPGRRLYQLVIGIQKHLNVCKVHWKLIDDIEFDDMRIVLDNVMKERASLQIGTIRKQADVITYKQEAKMWNEEILGEDSPDTLCNTVLYLLGVNLALRAGDEHYCLRRDVPGQDSQLSFRRNLKGVRCLVYEEDTVTKCNDGGLNQMRKQCKIVWVHPSENITKCPVRLSDNYIGLCPRYYKKANFYLQSLQKPNPCVWYAEQVVGINTIKKTVRNMLGEANVNLYFMNHSLRLFQAGIDRKLAKEVTGHSSDVVDLYQITSDTQRETISKVMREKPIENVDENC